MSGRLALLIGCQVGKLTGCELDVKRMSQALAGFGFETRSLVAGQATRDGILTAYDELIARSNETDAVCIYYSGHGSRVENPRFTPAGGVPQYLQYIIPTDDGPEEFRGIMSFELSRRLARLTQKTRNVSVILDCCHAGSMSRDAARLGLVPKLHEPRLPPDELERLLDADPEGAALVDPWGNPHAVRLVASEAETPAFEHTGADGTRTGVLTEALLCASRELDDEPVSWHALGLRVRELVMRRVPDQRPELEGPRARLLWSLTERPLSRAVSVFLKNGRPCLRAGWLQGARPGAEYGVMPIGSDAYRAEAQIARALVVETTGALARVSLEPPDARVEAGQPAFPLKLAVDKRGVVLGPGVPESLRRAIADSPLLTPAPAGDPLPPSITLEGDRLVLRDPLGDVLVELPGTAQPITLLPRLESIARAEELRQADVGSLRVKLRVELGRVEHGRPVPMNEGETFYVGDRLYVVIHNVGFQPLYVALLNIDAAYDVTLLTALAPEGALLEPAGQPLYFGRTDTGLAGSLASWPDGLSRDPRDPHSPHDLSRRETLLVVAAVEQQDFRLLAREPTRGAPPPPPNDFAIKRIDYRLHPGPRP